MIRYPIYACVIILVSIILVGSAGQFFGAKIFFEKTSGDQKKYTKNTAPHSDAPIVSPKGREVWSGHIDAVGLEIAYENFKQEYKSREFGEQHIAAHVLGELIYEKGGVGGAAICDGTFAFGCYHSFFTAAISDNGLGILQEIEDGCIEKFGSLGTGCTHGIGHGILEYMGHERLKDAINECAKLSWQKPLFGCQSGVFMEYNFPTLIGSTGAVSSIRRFDADHPYLPCPEAPERFRQACYFEMPEWWNRSGIDFRKIGKFCGAIVGKKEKNSCYLGAGGIVAPRSNYDTNLAISYCKEMGTSEGELLCRSGTAWAFFSVPERRSLVPLLCEGLDTERKRRCVGESDIIGNGEIKSVQ